MISWSENVWNRHLHFTDVWENGCYRDTLWQKKAQELGADCQITGIFTGGELTAFACAFEYTGLKRNGRKWLNPGDKEWRQIETLGTNVVVIPLLVGKEKVGRLIELLREQYRDSHLLFRISGEQSEKFQEDLAVVSEKNLKSHRYDAAGENVWLFILHRRSEWKILILKKRYC